MEMSKEALWVLRAQCDDREALELLLRSVQPSLLHYLCGIVGSADADDILQEVLVIVFRKLRWLECPELFRPWAFRIASRAAFRHLKRKKQRQAHDEELLYVASVLDAPPSTELLQQLANNSAISPASRAVLVLHFQEEMPLPAVAAILEVPIGTVKSRLAYGLAALRKQFTKKRRF